MTDTDRLNAIEIYDFSCQCQFGKWIIIGNFKGFANGKTLREAIDNAILAQTATNDKS